MLLHNKTPTKCLDISGKQCPYTLIDASKILKKMKKGEVLEIMSDFEPAVRSTIPAMCEKNKYPYEVVEIENGKRWKIFIQKK